MATLDNVMRFTAQVSREHPDMPAKEQVELATRMADEFEASGGGSGERAEKRSGPSIREIIEPEFVKGGHAITVDRHDFHDQHGIGLTYQSIRSALRKYITSEFRLAIRETEDEFIITRVAQQAGESGLDSAIKGAMNAERARICGEIDELLGDSFRDRALLKALKIIVRQGE